MTKVRRLLVAIVVLTLVVESRAAIHADDKNEVVLTDVSRFARKLHGASTKQLAKFKERQKKGHIEVAPIHLPIDPPGNCNHYGWPVATMVGKTIVVMHRRIPGHNPRGAGGPDEKMPCGVML